MYKICRCNFQKLNFNIYIDIYSVHFKVNTRFISESKAWIEECFGQGVFHIEGESL